MTTKTLRFYEQAQVLPPPARTASGYRDYDETSLARLRFVRAAQAADLSIAEIRTIITVREDQGPPCGHLTALLDRQAAALGRAHRRAPGDARGGLPAPGPRDDAEPGHLLRGRRLPRHPDRLNRWLRA